MNESFGGNAGSSSIEPASNVPMLENDTDNVIEESSAEGKELPGNDNDLDDGEEGEDVNSVTHDEN